MRYLREGYTLCKANQITLDRDVDIFKFLLCHFLVSIYTTQKQARSNQNSSQFNLNEYPGPGNNP